MAHPSTGKFLAGIEAGGTKFKCVIATPEGEVVDQAVFATAEPQHTLPQVADYLVAQSKTCGRLQAVGIASFGPLELNPAARFYGHVLNTPKPGWSGFDLRGYFTEAFRVPVGFNTDVNGALLGEYVAGAAKGLSHCVYITIGTGIGGGVMIGGRLLQGITHPEIGHSFVLQHPADTFKGVCPFHQNCLEGLASGPALKARWGIDGQALPANSEAWNLQAYYLAQLCVNLTLCYCPEKIILGGGVMGLGKGQQNGLLSKIRQQFAALINGYCSPHILQDLDTYLVPPLLGDDAGTRGAIYLAEQALT